MALFILRKLILQTRVRSDTMELDVCFFCRTLRLLPYFMCANSEGSSATARMRRLAWAFADRLCDKYHNLMSWPMWFCITCPIESYSVCSEAVITAGITQNRSWKKIIQISGLSPRAVLPQKIRISGSLLGVIARTTDGQTGGHRRDPSQKSSSGLRTEELITRVRSDWKWSVCRWTCIPSFSRGALPLDDQENIIWARPCENVSYKAAERIRAFCSAPLLFAA